MRTLTGHKLTDKMMKNSGDSLKTL